VILNIRENPLYSNEDINIEVPNKRNDQKIKFRCNKEDNDNDNEICD